MIEKYLNTIINDLGATGLLVIGLYWILYGPIRVMARHLEIINKELGEIRDCIKAEIKDTRGKT